MLGPLISRFTDAKMALKKVRGNLERMFDKNLTDLVRGIRNNRENEVITLCFLLKCYIFVQTLFRPNIFLNAWKTSNKNSDRTIFQLKAMQLLNSLMYV